MKTENEHWLRVRLSSLNRTKNNDDNDTESDISTTKEDILMLCSG